jgi:hypothetical protein
VRSDILKEAGLAAAAVQHLSVTDGMLAVATRTEALFFSLADVLRQVCSSLRTTPSPSPCDRIAEPAAVHAACAAAAA